MSHHDGSEVDRRGGPPSTGKKSESALLIDFTCNQEANPAMHSTAGSGASSFLKVHASDFDLLRDLEILPHYSPTKSEDRFLSDSEHRSCSTESEDDAAYTHWIRTPASPPPDHYVDEPIVPETKDTIREVSFSALEENEVKANGDTTLGRHERSAEPTGLIDAVEERVSSLFDDPCISQNQDTPLDDFEDEEILPESKPYRAHKISEKKREDVALFQSWLQKNPNAGKKRPTGADQEMTTNWLVKQGQNKKIIDSPREYQLELFEIAKERNTIIVLDTGSGKTLIAMLLLKDTIEKEAENRANGKPPKTSFFLVEKVALVDQQWSALSANLPYGNKIGKYCGKEVHSWGPEYWEEGFRKNMVVVCTAPILQRCLAHGYITIPDINLLILDEAHHAKKDHPFSRIIKDYYNRVPKDKRPRILGMTASPVDTKEDVPYAAGRLELLLQSRIATVSESTLDTQLGRKNHQGIIEIYPRLAMKWESDLISELDLIIGSHPILKKQLQFSKNSAREHGAWFAHRYWKLCFTDAEYAKWMAKAESFDMDAMIRYPTGNAAMIVQRVQECVLAYRLPKLSDRAELMSTKTLCLLRILQKYFCRDQSHSHKCIIFVDQRNAAQILTEMFNEETSDIRMPYLKSAYLVGSQSDGGPGDMSYRDAVVTIHKFCKGELNCLFASSVAEEGIDIPDCDVIIRFNLPTSMIQYIQSKGRARHASSTYISMAEQNSHKHAKQIRDLEQSASLLRQFCSRLPEDRLLDSGSRLLCPVDDWERGLAEEHYDVPGSGAKLTFSHSIEVLATFVSSLQDAANINLGPDYMVMRSGDGYRALVSLPEKSPVRAIYGDLKKSKHDAKCSAAFKLCVELVKKKYINEHLRPIFQRYLPSMRNARLAVSCSKKERYNMLLKPTTWSKVGPVEMLFAVALTLARPQSVGRPSRPLILLSREPLPQISEIPMFFGEGAMSCVRLQQISKPLDLRGEKSPLVEGLLGFTLRVFQDVFSKCFDTNSGQFPYFLAPSSKQHEYRFTHAEPACVIDWAAVKLAQENESIKIGHGDDPVVFFQNRFVKDPFDGSRKLYTVKVRPDMHPSDPVPEGVPAPRHRDWKSRQHTICEYSNSLWRKSREARTWDMAQPVIEAVNVSLRRNLLDDYERDEATSKSCFIIMEPLEVSSLSAETVAMAFTFPTIIHRIDNNLVALDGCNILGLDISPELALEAFTKDSDNSEEHSEEQVNFQGGMGNNYERLEFLGDCFLKMATTIAIFTASPERDEFEYHVERMILICNQNLFNCAVAEDRRLQEYVRSKKFDRRTWYPCGVKLTKGKAPKDKEDHSLSDKSIADVCEAVIGAAYQTHVADASMLGMPGTAAVGFFDEAVKAVTAVTRNKRHAMQSWAEYYKGFKIPAWQIMDTDGHKAIKKFVAEKTGYVFIHPALLRSAFKHPSYPYESNIPSYQRLEFLGDSLLDMVCVDFLFRRFPEADPQWLTEHKMAMVSNQFLACLCVELEFHPHMACLHAEILTNIGKFAATLKKAKIGIDEEVVNEQPEKATQTDTTRSPPFLVSSTPQQTKDFWLRVDLPAPKCLSDIVEAFIGAIFVDAQYDFSVVAAFFERHVRPYFEDMSLYDSFANRHPITLVSRRLGGEFGCRCWRVVTRETAPDEDEGANTGVLTETKVVAGILVHGKVVVAETAQSGRSAKVAAAKAALKWLEGFKDRDEFAEMSGCDCKEKVEGDGKGGTEEGDSLEAHGTAC